MGNTFCPLELVSVDEGTARKKVEHLGFMLLTAIEDRYLVHFLRLRGGLGRSTFNTQHSGVRQRTYSSYGIDIELSLPSLCVSVASRDRLVIIEYV